LAALSAEVRSKLDDYNTFLVDQSEVEDPKKLDSNNPLRLVLDQLGSAALTMYTAPHALRAGRYQKTADSFAFKLAAAYPERSIFRDYFTSSTVQRSQGMLTRPLGAPKDFVILRAKGDTGVTDYGVVADLEAKYIAPNAIPQVTYDGTNAQAISSQIGGRNLNVIVLTAHSSEALRKMVYDLGNAGAFRDNVVIFLSCRTEVTRHLTEFIGGKGAKSVVVADRAIPVDQATNTLIRLFEKLGDPKSSGELLRGTIIQSFDAFGGIVSVSSLEKGRNKLHG